MQLRGDSWNGSELPARPQGNTGPNDQFAKVPGSITTTEEEHSVLGCRKKCTWSISRNCFPLWKYEDPWGIRRDNIYKPFRNVKYKPNTWGFSTCSFLCSQIQLYIFQRINKPPCVHVTTGNKTAHYYLVINFEEALEFLQKFPSSVSLKDNGNTETCSLAQSKPLDFRNFRQVKWEGFSPTSVWIKGILCTTFHMKTFS